VRRCPLQDGEAPELIFEKINSEQFCNDQAEV
jgi:hypothetical protein